MISYVKIWTIIMNNPEFKSLKAHGRGVWLQLLILAKMNGDTGVLTFNSWADIGTSTGCDGKTARKFIGFFRENSMIEIIKTDPVIVINICKYKEWQRLKNDKEWREKSPRQGIFLTNNNKNNNNNSKKKKNYTDIDPNNFIQQKTYPYDKLKTPYENLMIWNKSKESDEMVQEFSATPGFEIEWVQHEFFESFVPWVKIESDKAKESLFNNYGGSWKSMFFNWLKRAKRNGDREKYYQGKRS